MTGNSQGVGAPTDIRKSARSYLQSLRAERARRRVAKLPSDPSPSEAGGTELVDQTELSQASSALCVDQGTELVSVEQAQDDDFAIIPRNEQDSAPHSAAPVKEPVQPDLPVEHPPVQDAKSKEPVMAEELIPDAQDQIPMTAETEKPVQAPMVEAPAQEDHQEAVAGEPSQQEKQPKAESLADAVPTDLEPASLEDHELMRLPGAGPGLVWMLNNAGITSLADMAAADTDKLRTDLGVVGELLDLQFWVDSASAARSAIQADIP